MQRKRERRMYEFILHNGGQVTSMREKVYNENTKIYLFICSTIMRAILLYIVPCFIMLIANIASLVIVIQSRCYFSGKHVKTLRVRTYITFAVMITSSLLLFASLYKPGYDLSVAIKIYNGHDGAILNKNELYFEVLGRSLMLFCYTFNVYSVYRCLPWYTFRKCILLI